jgi:hypothetical protein
VSTLEIEESTRVFEIEEAGNVLEFGAAVTIVQGEAAGVTGPGSSTDNAIARFHLATGGVIQNSAVTIDDSGNIATTGTVDGVDVSGIPATVTAAQAAAIASAAASMASHVATGTGAHPAAVSGGASGLMTGAQSTKLDGIETGATADQSAAEILAALLTVDGAGSLLDADLLDGQSSAAFATAANLTSHTSNTSNPHGVTAAQVGAIPSPASPDEADVLTYTGGAWVASPPAGGGLPAVGTLRGWSVANHYTIADITSGQAAYTLYCLVRLGRQTGTRQSIFFGDRMKLQFDDSNTPTIRFSVADSAGSLVSDITGTIQGDLGRFGLFSVGRRNNGGTLECFAGLNGWRWYATPGGGATAPSVGGSIHLGSGDAAGQAGEADIAAYAAMVGTYADPTDDLTLLDAAMEAGTLVQTGGLLTHLWTLSGVTAPSPWVDSIATISATRTGAALTYYEAAARW